MSSLNQDHFAFEDFSVMDTVIQGHKELYQVMKEKDALYAKPDFGDEDGVKAAELESKFAELDGWNRSEEHTSELQSRFDLVCRLLLEKKKKMGIENKHPSHADRGHRQHNRIRVLTVYKNKNRNESRRNK